MKIQDSENACKMLLKHPVEGILPLRRGVQNCHDDERRFKCGQNYMYRDEHQKTSFNTRDHGATAAATLHIDPLVILDVELFPFTFSACNKETPAYCVFARSSFTGSMLIRTRTYRDRNHEASREFTR